MAVITVGSTILPTPTDMAVGIMDITKSDRNTNGTMIMERIATKRKISLQWKYLSSSDLSTVLNAVSPLFFSVTYTDPVINGLRTGTFYVGDRNIGVMDIQNGVIRYKDIKFDLIEQ